MFSSVLVTGGAGFIGSHFVDMLLQKGKKVVVIDKLTYAADLTYLPLKDIVFIEGDINDSSLIEKILEEHSVNTVVNIAAESHVDNSIVSPDLFVYTNIQGTASLLKCCLKYLRKNDVNFKYIQVSTDEVYGTLGKEGYFVESSPITPRSPYSASKAAADHLVSSWFHTYNFPAIITRCSNNYGPRQHNEKLIPKTILNALSKRDIPIYGKGENIRDWIYVDDHCQGIIKAIEHGTPGEVYCFGGGYEKKNLDIVDYICELLSKDKNFNYKSLVKFVEDRLGHDYRYAIDFSYAKNTLGFSPKISFTQGMQKTIEWYKGKWESDLRKTA